MPPLTVIEYGAGHPLTLSTGRRVKMLGGPEYIMRRTAYSWNTTASALMRSLANPCTAPPSPNRSISPAWNSAACELPGVDQLWALPASHHQIRCGRLPFTESVVLPSTTNAFLTTEMYFPRGAPPPRSVKVEDVPGV